MRQSLCLVLLALVASSLAQSSTILFDVLEADRRCAADTDCTYVGNACCADSTCSYAAVNTTKAPLYKERLAANVCNVACTQNICKPPVVSCVFVQTSGGIVTKIGLCTLAGPIVDPLPPVTQIPVDPTVPTVTQIPVDPTVPTVTQIPVDPTVPVTTKSPVTLSPPKVEACQIYNGGNNCEAMCVSSQLAMPAIACLPTATQECVSTCKRTYAVCKLANTSAGVQSCQFVAPDVTLYQGCVDKCRSTPPPPPPVNALVCTEVKGAKCDAQCVIGNGIVPPTNNASCTATGEVACFNRCQGLAKCSATTLGCKYVPNNETEYLTCLKSCSTSTTPRCFKSGCSGEICSSVSVISTCEYTCEKGCYSAASCAATADNTCAFTVTDELKGCLAKCAGEEPTVPPPADTCKIAGCQRELCVPLGALTPQCDATISETSCENSCLQYATCAAVSGSVFPDSTTSGGASACGWIPSASDPSAYGECLLKCRQPSNPCFVSGCGSLCSSVASLQPCQESLIAPDCPTACKQKYTSCSLTSTGCGFLPVDGLQKCLESCPTTSSPVATTPACPSGLPQVECLVNPCDTASCPAHPDAKCTPNYCGSCRAIFTVNGAPVNCDSGCAGLPCDRCLAKAECSFCSGEYATATGTNQFGVCVASQGAGAEKCLANNGRLLASDASSNTCPVISGPVETESSVGDADSIQNEVAQSTRPVLSSFALIVTLVVNETSTSSTGGHHLVNMFLDVIGNGKPTTTQLSELCEILKDALVKTDVRVPNRSSLSCDLTEKTSLKRDATYAATMSFPATNGNGVDSGAASAVVASLAAVVVAVLAAF